MNGKDLTGQRFGRWTVLEHAGRTIHGALTWLCRCDCGTERVVSGNTLRMGTSRSCGCLMREEVINRLTTHGMSGSREYQAWADMIARCENPNHGSFAEYGGRGIKVCDLWRQSFEAFLADMGPRPRRHSLDRIDNDGDYEPGNCRWATPAEQAVNRRTNHRLEFAGRSFTISQWAQRTGIPETTIHKRLKLGWPVGKVLTEPIDVSCRNCLAHSA